jgi:DNA processing protein
MPETSKSSLFYQIALTLIPGVGPVSARRLLTHVGSAEALFKEKRSNLLKIFGIGELTINAISNHLEYFKRAEQELLFIDEHKIGTYFIGDENYPYRLKQCADSPVLLYGLGNFDLDSKHIVSIVGTRMSTDYGKEMCRTLIEGLADIGVVIISGLAHGIDTLAHKYALEENLSTVGILGHGLDIIYPAANRALAQRMLANGGLLTEFMSNILPDRENFPMRNRIIAGLSDATIVIEAGSKGGALITADIANSYNRDVFAVPGRVSDNYSAGCNSLIKTNRAALVQKAEDVMYIMGWERQESRKVPVQKKLFIQLEPDQETIVNILKEYDECSIDRICLLSELSPSKIAVNLLNLEFEGVIKSLPGKFYKLI